ncbi:hypothetical protein DXG01_013838 [Tephrocybe rancida]|nr:hypothetical protein DXG01_013838 [Tephrocybe rancida]
MFTSRSIAPFAIHAAPPHPMSVLLSATDVAVDEPGALLVHQDLVERRPLRNIDHRPHPYLRKTTPFPQITSPVIATPSSIVPPPISAMPPSISTSSMLRRETSSPLSSPPPSSRSVSPNPSVEHNRAPLPSSQAFPPKATAKKHRIPRPVAAGRRELSKFVDWEKTLLDSVKSHTRILTGKYLDSAKSYKQQDEEKLEFLRKKACPITTFR